jgi:signal transduction histidine kinase/ligand-binding sensor domain-containing protein/ActR/RegA family two-component response regulator
MKHWAWFLGLLTLVFSLTVRVSYPHGIPAAAENRDIRFCQISIKDGLSQNTIRSIFQDRKGFMWFGTQGGVNRYDGYGFKTYTHVPDSENSLCDDFVYAILDDPDGGLWFGTGNGLSYFDPVRERFTCYRYQEDNPAGLSCNYVKALYRDSKGVLWIGTWGKGLNRFHPETGTFSHYMHDPDEPGSLSSNRVVCMVEDDQGYLWVGTSGGGINRMDPETGKFTRYCTKPAQNKIPGSEVLCVAAGKGGDLWMGTWKGGITRFNLNTKLFKIYQHDKNDPNSLSDNIVFSLLVTETGEVWAGTQNGLNHWHPGTGHFRHYHSNPNRPGSLGGNHILSLFRDRGGDIWAGTAVSGVNRLEGGEKNFALYRQESGNPNSLNNNNVYAFHEDPGDPAVLWIGTRGGGLNRLNRKTGQFKVYKHDPDNPHSLGHDEVHALKRDRSGTLWIGTFGGGVYQFLEKEEKFVSFKGTPGKKAGLNGNYVSCIFEDGSGAIWVGTMDGGINRFDRTTRRFKNYGNKPGDKNTLSNNFTRTIYEEKEKPGILWIGTEGGGLNRLETAGGAFTHYLHNQDDPNSLSHNMIMSFHRDRRGIFWIGTAGNGLNRFDPSSGRFNVFTVSDGLANNTVYGILEDDSGQLWLSTNRGLSRFNISSGEFKNYDVHDGLQSNEFNFGAAFKCSSGEMFFGGVNGFNAFFPDRVKDNPNIPPVLITDFKLFNETVPVGETGDSRTLLEKSIMDTDEISLCYDDAVISFEYTALNYRFADKNQYKYIMEGFDKKWNSVGDRRFATYTNLPPGSYVFRVKGSNNDGIWNEEGRSLRIIVTPPFWLTWWFAPLMILLFLSFIITLHRLRLRKEKIVNRRLEQEVTRRTREAEYARLAAEEANKSKSQFLARMSHEIRTPLNGVIGFIDMLKDTDLSEEQEDYVKSVNIGGRALLSLVNDILDFSKIEAGHMALEEIDFSPADIVAEVLDIVRPKIGKNPVKVMGTIDPAVPGFVFGDAARFRQVLFNLMGNAAKFTEKGEIVLHVEVETERAGKLKLHTTVSDTGIGIAGEKLSHIFDIFQQADGSTTRQYGGSGLGLSICRQVAHLMDGDVWVESEVGKGSTFHFTAWLKRSAKQEIPKETSIETPKETVIEHKNSTVIDGETAVKERSPLEPKECEAGERDFILLVEDNALNQKLARYMLNRAGYCVDLAVNGKEAVDMVTSEPDKYRLILMDIQMPEMDGIEATRIIRRKGFKDIPIVAMTAQALKGERERCMETGMNDFISKPIKRETVFQTVQKWTS